jgi:hypothetical protein
MRRRRVLALALVASLAVVAAAGCGGDDDDTAGAPPRSNGTATTTATNDGGSSSNGSTGGALSQSEFVRKAEAACATFEQKFEESLANFDPSSGDVSEVAGKAADALHGVADELRKIGYPSGKHDEANQLYDAIDKAADEMKADPRKVVDDSEGNNQIDTLSKDLGLHACGV